MEDAPSPGANGPGHGEEMGQIPRTRSRGGLSRSPSAAKRPPCGERSRSAASHSLDLVPSSPHPSQDLLEDLPSGSGTTLVFVDGLFGMGVSVELRKTLAARFPGARLIGLRCGGVSSVRDRAVECFYQLKGGVVDYSAANGGLEPGHARFGRVEEGLFKEWGENAPVHLIAYSLGAPTARYLQHLLVSKAFRNEHGEMMKTTGSWISSIVCINGANNGSVAVHAVGLSRKTLEPASFSILWWIFTIIYLIVWLNVPFVTRWCDLRLDHWEVRREHGVGLLQLLRWRPGVKDNGGRDLSPARASELNAEVARTLPHADTRYIACYSSCTRRVPDLPTALRTLSKRHLPDWKVLLRFPYCFFLVPFALIIGITTWGHHTHPHIKDDEAEAEECKHASDGVVSVRCQQAPARQIVKAAFGSCSEMCAAGPKGVPVGAWTHVMFGTFDHVEVIQDGEHQRAAFENLCAVLVQCDIERCAQQLLM
mmetsp:Transcript_38261/g.94036  ORF Transcript_38261/g.94036 Transcript_38261/m.94036 type:complete len:481 (-) Transcript_38261:233-1675(-)